MAKRKATRKKESAVHEKKAVSAVMSVPALMMKILAGILAVIMVIALTLYVLGRMPARGFWVLAIILAIIAFVIMPAMRRKFVEMG
ncbi:hypothetical protein KY349_02865 [Candidatus Woesearchaeota archaeon]|jgi:hypothetical protein|nr:hypothetical protein [Candidatus Woesearchaeota archaeon]